MKIDFDYIRKVSDAETSEESPSWYGAFDPA